MSPRSSARAPASRARIARIALLVTSLAAVWIAHARRADAFPHEMMDANDALDVADDAWAKVGYDARALPPSLQVVHLIGRLDIEVMLGGVLGWLTNAGEYGPDTAKALDAVEAHQCASIVREIFAFFPGGTPAFEDRERVRQIENVIDVAEDHWSDLGDRLLAYPDDIYVLLERFIEKHEADFS